MEQKRHTVLYETDYLHTLEVLFTIKVLTHTGLVRAVLIMHFLYISGSHNRTGKMLQPLMLQLLTLCTKFWRENKSTHAYTKLDVCLCAHKQNVVWVSIAIFEYVSALLKTKHL